MRSGRKYKDSKGAEHRLDLWMVQVGPHLVCAELDYHDGTLSYLKAGGDARDRFLTYLATNTQPV